MSHPPKNRLALLEKAAFCYPIIDNHAHNLLKEEHDAAASVPFEGLTSEASGAALKEATHSIAFYRAITQLACLLRCEPTLEAVKKARHAMSYDKLCKTCLAPTGIQSMLLDDGIDKLEELCYDYKWHDRLASAPSKRIVRIEVLAQNLIKTLVAEGRREVYVFESEFEDLLAATCKDPEVVALKSVACYRTGLDITEPGEMDVLLQYRAAFLAVRESGNLRLAHKALNDFIVRMALKAAGHFRKPVQFHTGLGDNDIMLQTANPSVMQSVIKEFPDTTFVLLHSSYPFTQEAGYLTSVYKNVYLDFGEVFPMVSRSGQIALLRHVLELSPTTKILWSTDGHWWPETYYLAAMQVREAMYEVLSECVLRGDMTEPQAATVVERAFFHNANELYQLGLTPRPSNLIVPSLTPPPGSVVPTLDNLAAQGTRFVRLHWVDLSNTVRYRVVPIARLQRMLAKSAHGGVTITKACMGLIGEALVPGFGPSGEYILVPDLDSLRAASYADGHAFVMGTFEQKEPVKQADGTETVEVDVCPRTVLRRIVDSAKTCDGLEFLVGFETEFVLFGQGEMFLTPLNHHGWCSSGAIPSGSAVAKALDEVADALEKSGIELQQYHSESAEGQYEVVTGPLPPLQAVDALVATREIIFNVAEKHGLRATLSPKPWLHQAGSASHTHISLISSSAAASTPAGNAPISKLEASFLQSLLDHLPAACAFTLPSPASYSRMVDAVWSGGTWICWGRDNREAPVRLCGTASQGWHFEVKALDGTANPYLAIAALLHAGILGVRKGLELRLGDLQGIAQLIGEAERAKLGIIERLPRDLGLAIKALRKDEELVSGFSQDLVTKYISTIEARRKVVEEHGEELGRHWMARFY